MEYGCILSFGGNKGLNMIKAWTDYPITGLGDIPNQKAPVRECKIIAYDCDKYCTVRIGDYVGNIKSGYLYDSPGRHGEAKPVSLFVEIKEKLTKKK